MRIIEIKTAQDFDKLKTIEKKEKVMIKIYDIVSNITISAIDLNKFQGMIYVVFVNPKRFYKFQVVAKSTTGNNFLFSNINASSISIFQNNYEISYQVQDDTFFLSKDQDFDQLPKVLLPKTKLKLKNDFILIRKCSPFYQGAIIDGNYHKIYGKRKVISSWIRQGVVFKNASFVEVDQILPIHHFHDLNLISKYPKHKVVAFLTKNIVRTKINPVCLDGFYGTLFLFGNGYNIDQVELENNDDTSIGLISSISSYANFLCENIHISNLTFPNSEKENIGAILGEKRVPNTKYITVPGYTRFQNCSVKKTYIPKSENSGVFIGKTDEFTELFLCSTEKINGISPSIFSGDSYFDENHLEDATYYFGEKRIVIPSRKLRKEIQ